VTQQPLEFSRRADEEATGAPEDEPALTGPPADPVPAVRRLKLVVSYDGTGFRGFAEQPDFRTVAGTLVEALEKVLRAPREALELVCAGRTDAGVHAWGQVVSLAAPPDTDPDHVARVLNRLTAPEIVVRSCEVVDEQFDARRSAYWRTYRYTIVNRPEPDPFLARYAWWVPGPLDLAQLRLAADPFVGEHDFSAFCRRPSGSGPRSADAPGAPLLVRRVLRSGWASTGDGILVYEITARAFCWQMVRSIVGTLVAAGSGRSRPGDILTILRSGDRSTAVSPAPAHGLSLWAVGYEAFEAGS
jgi:tRNA pseudouridine38-40 synthase